MAKPLILCADDNPSFLTAWGTLLESEGFKIVTASDGNEALQIFLSQPVDLALLDYHMPTMNGDVAAERMRSHKPNIPIALLSSDDFMSESSLRHVDAFIFKGERTSRILEIIGHLLGLRDLFQPLKELRDVSDHNAA